MPGTLFVVATPIGNLEDVTLRALRVLREVSLIAAEDTRRTMRLLQHYSISTPATSLHEHNEHAKTRTLIARLAAGESIALVSDAGTPAVSDPGAAVVAAAHAAGIKVEPIPGASAAIAALSIAGIGGSEFVFVGFPPHRANARIKWFRRLVPEARPIVLYEAPHRIRETLEDLLAVFGDRTVTLCRELTKLHEELVVRPISELLNEVKEPKGEYTLVIHSAVSAPEASVGAPEPAVLADEFGVLTNSEGLSRREALKRLAEKYDVPAREVFAVLERAKISVE
jgi:16S rRNA (cytidine1402-2'-O)-methyltransferase